MIRKWLSVLAIFAFLPSYAFAEISSKVLIPIGVDYFARNATKAMDLPPGATYGSINIPGQLVVPVHKEMIQFEHAMPATLLPYDNRHTIAMDVLFENGYLASNAHMDLISRRKIGTYTGAGDNRGGAIVLGGLPSGYNAVAGEEIEITDAKQNVMHQHIGTAASPFIHENTWYRIAVDTIFLDGKVYIEARVWNLAAGNTLIYNLPTTLSNYSYNYPQVGSVTIFHIPVGNTGNYRFSNLKSYWSNGREWVQNP